METDHLQESSSDISESNPRKDTDTDSELGEKTLLSQTIGNIGRWQVEKITLLALSSVPLAWHYLSYPLLSTEKKYWCNDTKLDLNNTINTPTSDECLNCQNWVFEETGFVTIQEDFELVCDRVFLLSIRQSVFFLGMMFGSFTGYLSDYYGRKPSLLILSMIWSITSLLHTLVPPGHFYLFLVLQFFLALTAQSAWSVSWVWSIEVVGNGHYRATVGLSILYFWALGFATAPVVVLFFDSWRLAFLAMSIPTVLFLFYAIVIPESPMWLLSKGRLDEAKKIMNQAAKRNGLSPAVDFDGIDEKRSTENVSENVSWWKIFASPNLRCRTLIFCYAWFVASFCYYGLSLNAGNLGGDLFITFAIHGILEIPAIAFANVSVIFLGRRLPTVLLVLVAGLSCLGAVFIPLLMNQKMEMLTLCLAMLGKMCMTAFFYSLFVYTSEIYSTTLRGTGLAFCSVFARIAGMVSPLVGGLYQCHPLLPVAIFGTSGLLAAFLMTFLPETKGRSLPQTVDESEKLADGDVLWICIKKIK